MAGTNPREFYAPEIIDHDGQFFIAGYRYSETRTGIYMAPFTWAPGDTP